jgi:hypothetical protein
MHPFSVLRGDEPLDTLAGLIVSGCPDDDVRSQLGSIREHHAVLVETFDLRVGLDLDRAVDDVLASASVKVVPS